MKFTSEYSPGPSWEQGKPLSQQQGFASQDAWWKAHEQAGRLRFSDGPRDHPEGVLVVWECATFNEALDLAGDAPMLRGGRLMVRTSQGTSGWCGVS